ncbi:MAG TPA: flagellar export chaperone FliS [Phycisphaerales bacterium]|nr:flagellar export chaperone FliS [Phycisphaerales bacterium]
MPSVTATPTPSKPANEYLKTRVLTASPEELRLMLLDGSLKYAMQAREGLTNKNPEHAFNGFTACRDIVTELMTTIRREPNPQLADQVRAVYSFIFQLLVEAGFERSIEKLDKAVELLQFERETWVLLMQKVAEERGRKPAETVAPNAPARPALSLQG